MSQMIHLGFSVKLVFNFLDLCVRLRDVRSQMHDFEVDPVTRPACVLSVSLKSTYLPFTSIRSFR